MTPNQLLQATGFSLLFLSHSFLLSTLLGLASADDPKMGDCVPKSCGSLNISYPFWLSGQQPPYCGYPQFELHCRYDTVVLRERYFIKKLFYQNQSLMIGRFDWSFSDCPLPTHNISFDLTSFKTVEHLDSSSDCKSFVVPVLGYPGANGSNFISLLNNGFLLEWMAFDCTACRESHGQCGYNAERQDFMCICRDGTHLVKCGGIFENKKMIIGITTETRVFLFACFLFLIHLRGCKRVYHANLF